MADTKFTPGPWEAAQADSPKYMSAVHFLYANKGIGTVALVGKDHAIVGDADLDVQNANANLIAAAPELYAALERAVDALASLRGELEPPLTQVVRGRAALAKARGES